MSDDITTIRRAIDVEAVTMEQHEALFAAAVTSGRAMESEQRLRAVVANRPRRRTSRTLAIAIVAVLTGSAISGAAALNWGSHYFNQRDSPASDLKAFNAPSRDQVTLKEYNAILATRFVPPSGAPVGEKRPDSELVKKWEVAPIAAARVLVDDEVVGRLISVPTLDGRELCYHYVPPEISSLGRSAGCGLKFDGAGLVQSYGFGQSDAGETFELAGIAEDDVTSIRLEFADGRRDVAALRDNAFYWTAAGESQRPTRITTIRRDGTESVAPNQFTRSHDPYIVGN